MTATSDANGNVTFSVQTATTAGDSYVPVVYDNADKDAVLNLGTDNAPTEAFGTGQETTTYKAAQAGSFGNGGGAVQPASTVTSVGNNTFTTSDGTYTYKSTDQFYDYNGGTPKALTYSQFVSMLSSGDKIGGNYQPNGTSSFYLNDVAPAAPAVTSTTQGQTTPTGTNAGKGGVQISFNDSATDSVASYNVYRATATQPQIAGQTVTCPTVASGAYNKIGSVTDTANTGSYTYNDATAQQATNGAPAYCYYVTSVDQTGEESTPSTVVGPFTATAPAAATAPKFVAGATASGSTVVVKYNEVIKTASVDTNGSDYTVTTTNSNGVSTARAVTAATATNSGLPSAGVVTLQLASAIPTGDTVVVTAKPGTDTNTVLDSNDVAQKTGDQVQTTATADNSAPTMSAVKATAGTHTVTVTYSENVDPTTVDLDGSDYAVTTSTGGGAAVANAVTAATVSGNVVTLTVTNALTAGDAVVVDAQNGTDGDTVADLAGNFESTTDTATGTVAP